MLLNWYLGLFMGLGLGLNITCVILIFWDFIVTPSIPLTRTLQQMEEQNQLYATQIIFIFGNFS